MATVPIGRLEAFSDGVFAIAITLLVLEIPRPHGLHLAHQLGLEWRQFATFAVSFATIGIIWVNHHATVSRIREVTRTGLFLNLLLLLFVSFIPFPTGLLGEYLHGGPDARTAALLYSATLFAMGTAFLAFNLHQGWQQGLRGADLRAIVTRNGVGQATYLVAICVSLLSPAGALVLCGLVAVYYVLPGRVRPGAG